MNASPRSIPELPRCRTLRPAALPRRAEPALGAGIDDSATLRRLEAALIELAPSGAQVEPRLRALLQDCTQTTGKRLRGRLALAAARAANLDESAALQLAATVEYFHLASLLLDDLPCMDDADTRRGRPCAHRTHGEAMTLLAALALINRAYALLGFAAAEQAYPIRVQVHACFDACLGPSGLVGGQAGDLAFGESRRTPRDVVRIALRKTCALLWLSLLPPALLAGTTPDELRCLRALGLYWGLAFQALDDLRDLLSTTVDAGKTTARDRALDRPNLGLILGVSATRLRIQRLLTQAAARLAGLERLRPGWSTLRPLHEEFERAAAPLFGGGQEAAA